MKKFFVLFLLLVFVLVSSAFADNLLKDKIDAAIHKYITSKNPSWSDSKLKVLFRLNKRVSERLASYGSAVTFVIPDIYANSNLTSNMILPLQVLEDGIERERIFINTNISLFANVIATQNIFNKGDVFTADSLKYKEVNVLTLKGKPFLLESSVVGKYAGGYLSSGTILTDYMVRSVPDIAKNQQIDLFVSVDGLKIEAKGTALENGQIGEIIKVKRVNSSEIISGKIQSNGKIEVQL